MISESKLYDNNEKSMNHSRNMLLGGPTGGQGPTKDLDAIYEMDLEEILGQEGIEESKSSKKLLKLVESIDGAVEDVYSEAHFNRQLSQWSNKVAPSVKPKQSARNFYNKGKQEEKFSADHYQTSDLKHL